MAQFTADILLKVISTKAEEAVKRLTKQVERLNDAVKEADYDRAFGKISTAASTARQSINKLAKSFEKFGSLGAAAGVGGVAVAINEVARAAASASSSLNPFVNAWNAAGTAIHNVTGFLDPLNAALHGLGPTGQAAAAGIGIATTALMAFAPQLEGAISLANKAGAGLRKLSKSAKDGILGNLSEDFKLTNKAVQALDTSASGLRKTIADLTKEQQKLYADSSEYRNKTTEILNAEELLTTELKQQAKVLKELKLLRTGSAFKELGLGNALQSKQKLLPAFQERGLQQLNTGYAEALRLTKERAAATRTTLNVEEALANEVTRGTRFAEKSAEAAQRLRDYNGKVLTTSQGISQAMSVSAKVANSWQVALQQGARWQKLNAAESTKLLNSNRSTLSVYNAQIEAQKTLARLDKQRAAEQREQARLQKEQAGRLESLALGVGFPLLFGAGGGSILGSLAGSFAGKGFGGQIFGGAIGQVFDDFVAKVGELGRALNPLTADLETVVRATGNVGTATGRYITELDAAGAGVEALAAATRELESIVGFDGVYALQRFGDQTQTFANQWEVAMTQMGVALSNLLSGPLAAVISGLERANALRAAETSSDPELRDLFQQRQRAGLPGIFGAGFGGAKAQAELTEKILKRVQQLQKERQGLLGQTDQQALAINKRKLEVAKQELVVTKAGSDLTNDAVFAAELELLKRRDALEVTELYNKKMTDSARNQEAELLYIQQTNREQELRLKRQEALDKAAASVAKRAATESERASRERERSLKTGQRLIDQLELQVLKLDDIDKTTLAVKEAEFRRAQTQESINQLIDEEQRRIATTLNLERERLAIQDAYAKGAERIFKLNEQFYGGSKVAKLQELTTVGQAVISIGEGIGNAFKTSFDSIADGTQSAQQIISDFFKNIGNALINYATTAIANYIAIGIARIFAGVGSASVGGTDWGSMGTSQFGGGFGVDAPNLMGPAVPFAEGGFVTRPTNAVVGEGGEPEYVIPASKMGDAMSRYRAGSRGESVLAGAGEGSGGDYTYSPNITSTTFGGQDYVTVDQMNQAVREGMEVASKRGAQGGYAKTLNSLRNSRSTRARVGMG